MQLLGSGRSILFGVLPIVAVVVMFHIARGDNSLAIDFHNEIYPEAKELLAGTNPFPSAERRPQPRLELHLAAVRRLRRCRR